MSMSEVHTQLQAMKGYDVNSARVYNKQGTVLKVGDLKTLICGVCGFILREAVQVTQCGHRFCKDCIEKLMSESDGHQCPIDQERFDKVEVRKDRGCQREIDSLEVDCPTRPDPCTWRGPLVQIETHRLNCPNALVSCTLKCGLSLRRDQLEAHTRNDCPKRAVICEHCNEFFPYDVIKTHVKECPECPVLCNRCQMNIPSRKLVQNHLLNDCPNYEMGCPMECPNNFKGKQSDMLSHLNTHLLDIVQLLNKTMSRVEFLENKQKESDEKIADLTETVKKMKTVGCAMKKQLLDLESSANVKRGLVDEYERNSKHKDDDLSKAVVPFNTHGNGGAKASPTNSMDIVVRKEDAGMKERVEAHETQLLKMSETIQTMQGHITQYAVAIDDVRLRQDILDVKTTNGILTWKIPDVRRRYRDAVDGRTISLYSPPFYTSPHGYRMCIRAYLNGDGIGKGTHLSLFFVVMRSEQDNLLPWPFKQSVRFTLINQKNPSASITEAFVPDVKSPSFHKPENEMNVASGFPKFARQSVLHDENFTLGNTIFIKCQIDTTGLKLE